MNNKEFEDFFKNLEPDTEPKKTPSEDEDLVFSSFFEDATSSAKKEPEPVKTKNEVFGFAYAECSRTYVKLVQGVFEIFSNRRLTSACPKLSKRVQNTKRNRRFQYRAVVSVAQVT